MSSTYTVPSGTADGSLLTVSDAAVLRNSTIVGTLADGPDAGLSTVEIVAQADGSFVLAARTLEAGDTTSDDVVFTYTVRDTEFDASGTLAVRNLTAAGTVLAHAGALVLRGPYVLDYTDIPLSNNTKTLWTPSAGDYLVRLFTDILNTTPWDHGTVYFEQNSTIFINKSNDFDMPGIPLETTGPVLARLINVGDSPATSAGHFVLYALVARAVAP